MKEWIKGYKKDDHHLLLSGDTFQTMIHGRGTQEEHDRLAELRRNQVQID